MATVREVTYQLLRSLGMTTMFGNPGSTELPFLQDFPDDFTYVLGLQEATVVAMADGFAQATRHCALVNVHTAPGTGNAMGNIITAYRNKTPLIITAGQQVRAMMAIEPWLFNKEAVELPKPYVKWSYEPARAQDVPAAIARAYFTAMQAPRGPVFVSIPMDDWAVEVDPFPHREVSDRTAPGPQALKQAAEVMKSGQHPVLVIGAGVDIGDAYEVTIKLAERLRVPVWAAPNSWRSSFPEDHPLFQGALPAAIAPVSEKLAAYDVVMVIGSPIFNYYPYVPGSIVKDGTRVIQLTDDPDEAARAPVGNSVVGDLRIAIEQLIELLPASERALPAPRLQPETPPAQTPISTAFLMHTLAQVMPSNAIMLQETASNANVLKQFLRTNGSGQSYHAGSGGLGWAMPAAVGVQLAKRDRPVVCVVGEGASMYSIQALWTAAQHRLPIVFVVPRNGEYAILKAFAEFEQVGQNIPGLDVPGFDLVQIAQGFGCQAQRIEQPEDLKTALQMAMDNNQPTVIEVLIDSKVPALLS